MKITKRQLRTLIREVCLKNEVNLRHRRLYNECSITLEEGVFSGALKGLMRAIPGVGNVAADAHTSTVLDALDRRLTNMLKRIEALERRAR